MLRASQNISKRVPALRTNCSATARTCTNKASSQGASSNPTQDAKKAAPPPPPPPPPPPRRGGGTLWKLLGLSLTGALGGTIAYAWYDADFRNTVQAKVPYSRQAFDTVFQYLPPTPGSGSVQKELPASSKSEPPQSLAIDAEEAKKHSLLPKKPAPAIKEPEKKALKEADKAAPPKPTAAEIEAKRKEEAKKRAEEEKQRAEEKKRQEKEAAARKIQEQEMEAAAENAALENILQDNLRVAQASVATAIELQKAAAAATNEHSAELRKAMDQQGEGVENQWEAATEAFSKKAETLESAEVATEDARQEIERVRASITEGKENKITKKNAMIRSTEQAMNSLSYDLKMAIAEHAKAQSVARVMADYRDLVRRGRDQFRQELLSLAPASVGRGSGGRLSEDELNALIAHAHRRTDQLTAQLAEARALEAVRVDQALARQREEDERLADARVQTERERMAADLSVQRDKWAAEARVSLEVELRRELARQAAAHTDHLAEVLRVQERDLRAAFDVGLTDRLLEERDAFQREIQGSVARLKGIEAAVEGRAEMEQQARKSQELWLACQMLATVLRDGPANDQSNAEGRYETRLQPLIDEFIAVMDAGADHPLVVSVLESVPDLAVKRGVWTEAALTERFPAVRRVCRRTAMMDRDTAAPSLFRHLVSHAQSWLVFAAAPLPLEDCDRVDPAGLDTLTLLDNARHHLDRGDLETALRFMNQLRGEPRRLATDWITEARLLLETRQAADALLAHASAHGLGALS